MTRLWIDTETFSTVPLKQGLYRYAASAEITLFSWSIDDGPIEVWDCVPEPMPELLRKALVDPTVELWAHNAQFDRTLLRHAGSVIERNAAQDIERWRCTMAQALCHGFPGALGTLCDILKVPQDEAKDKDGRRLVLLFCKPMPAKSKIRRATAATHPEEWARFKSYAGRDISAMRAINQRLPVWNYRGDELALWHLDQKINDRGFQIDMDLVQAATRAVAKEQQRLGELTSDLTHGYVKRTTQRDRLLKFLLDYYDVDLPDLQASTLERRINDPDLPIELRDLLAIRLDASATSVAKYKTIIGGVNDDGRLRGTLQYSGAARTRRWAGRLVQPQNWPRPTMKAQAIENAIEALKMGVEDLIL